MAMQSDLEELMNGLSERLYQDWQKLGLALGLKMVALDRLSNQSRVHAERWPLRMLQVWRETADIPPVQELAQALQEMERADLVQLLRLGIMDTDGVITDELLARLAEHLAMDWYNLGIQLGVSSSRLDKIKMEEQPRSNLQPELEVLRQWRNGYGGHNIIGDLIHALRKVNRNDLVRYVEEHVKQKGKPSSSQDSFPKDKAGTGSEARSSSLQWSEPTREGASVRFSSLPHHMVGEGSGHSSLPTYLPMSSHSSSAYSRQSATMSSRTTDAGTSDSDRFTFLPPSGRPKKSQNYSTQSSKGSRFMDYRTPESQSFSFSSIPSQQSSQRSQDYSTQSAAKGSSFMDYRTPESQPFSFSSTPPQRSSQRSKETERKRHMFGSSGKSRSFDDRRRVEPEPFSFSQISSQINSPSPQQPITQAVGGSGMFDFKTPDSSEHSTMPSFSAFAPSPSSSIDTMMNSAVVTSKTSLSKSSRKK